MSNVIPLPGAALAPVIQTRRRGRYPKMVACFHAALVERRAALHLVDSLKKDALRWREWAGRSRHEAELALQDAAMLEERARAALRNMKAGRRHGGAV